MGYASMWHPQWSIEISDNGTPFSTNVRYAPLTMYIDTVAVRNISWVITSKNAR